MTAMRVIRLRFRLRELFSPTDTTATAFLRLMAVENDLDTLMKGWLCSNGRRQETKSEKNIVSAESNYIARLACATAYEASNVFREFRKRVKQSGRLADVEKLEKDGRDAFAFLENMFKAEQKDFEQDGFGKVFVRERNLIFHYQGPDEFGKAIEEFDKDQEGLVVVAEGVGLGRYLVADELQVLHTLKPLGGSFNNFGELQRVILEISNSLRSFANAWLALQVQVRSSALIGQDDDEIDVARLWPGLAAEEAKLGLDRL